MKKIGKKGFTLIELLAVITIMGILMLVAIPAISRTIENSRRDTFMNLGKQYIETVRNSVIADEITCKETATSTDYKMSVSATLAGKYYILLSTEALSGGTANAYVSAQTNDIMESGGKSAWGNNDVKGVVVWEKTDNGTSGFKTTYSVALIDKGQHGIAEITSEDTLSRTNVLTKVDTGTIKYVDLTTPANIASKFSVDSNALECKLK